jgi:hypothetical protein
MNDVRNGAARKDASDNRMANSFLLRVCEEFWVLENERKSLISDDGLVDPSPGCAKNFYDLQRRLIATLEQIRHAPVDNPQAFHEKLKVLKYRAVVTDYEERDIFRELVMLLDDYADWIREIGREQPKKPHNRQDEKKPWRFNLHNIFHLGG